MKVPLSILLVFASVAVAEDLPPVVHEIQLSKTALSWGETVSATWILRITAEKPVKLLTAGPTYMEIPFSVVRLANGKAENVPYHGTIGCFGKRVYTVLQPGAVIQKEYAFPSTCFTLDKPGEYEIRSAHISMPTEGNTDAVDGTFIAKPVRFTIAPLDEAKLIDNRERIEDGNVAAIKFAGSYGDAKAIPVLEVQATSKSEAAFAAASSVLADMNTTESIAALGRACLATEGAQRVKLAEALKRAKNPDSVPVFRKLLEDNYKVTVGVGTEQRKTFPVRNCALEALGNLGIYVRAVLDEGFQPTGSMRHTDEF